MSSTAKVKPAKNDAEWARNVEKKQDQAENSTTARVGPWVLSAQADTENLLASHVDGGAVILAVKPESTDEPDAVEGTDTPYIKVERQANQQGPRGSTVLTQWDTVAHQTPEWGFLPPGSDIVIPVDGVYAVHFNLHGLNNSTVINKAILIVGGVVKQTAQNNGANGALYPHFSISDTYTMAAGTVVRGGMYVSGSGTMDFGYSSDDPTVFTNMSIYRLPIG